jgi:hypothetical protein
MPTLHQPPTWPAETDLVLTTSSGRLNLSLQHPLICTVLKDGIERLRASLYFSHAFPNVPVAAVVSQASLLSTAEKYQPGTSVIYNHIMADPEYASKMCCLVSATFLR